ncbi:response regulator [Haloarchaeobius sp. HRN-SO-5]|uniref:response regulator n=1 Tax=Haloarchaeobius sp. HRN-SO-5 TaxID=3446118 RepID=UPI003EBA73C4
MRDQSASSDRSAEETATSDDTDPDGTVLVVDDDVDLADTYALWLRDSYEVRTAYGGDEALDACDVSVDHVVLDRRMPAVSGETVLRQLRARDATFQVAVVSAVRPGMEAHQLPFDAYLLKPVDRERLMGTVDRLDDRRSDGPN